MDKLFIELGITALLTWLKEAVKNPARRELLRAQMLKVAALITLVWENDAEFQEDLEAKVKSERKKVK